MRLNRKWLYLGGLVTILTLLLTLTLVLPAGAVGQLDPGSLDTDDGYVSPTADGDSMIEVTLSNSDLDITSTVESDGDIGPVTLTVLKRIIAVEYGSVTVDIRDDVSTNGFMSIDLNGDLASDVLPITGDVSIDYGPRGESSVTSGQVGAPSVRNRADGIVEFPINANLEVGDTLVLSYETSPQETALLNVSGDSGNFDLLALESAAGPAGDYSATVIAAQEVIIKMNSSVPGNNLGIVHEQHPVPGGLRGYVEFEDEEILTKRYSDWTPIDGFDNEVDEELAAGTSFYVQVAHPPIRDTDDNNNVDQDDVDQNDVESEEGNLVVAAVSDTNQGIIQMRVDTGSVLRLTDEVTVTYIGSDSFYIEVDHGPIQNMNGTDGAGIVVPMIDTDDSSSIENKLQVISFGRGVDDACYDCRVRIGVVTMPTNDDEPTPLDSRISVLGISYEGSERFALTSAFDAGELFDATLDFLPVNVDEDKIDGKDNFKDDIVVVARSDDFGAVPTIESVDGRTVTLKLADDAPSGATIDLAYALKVGANPRNALIPGAMMEDPDNAGMIPDRPIIAVAAGSRVAFTSDNDRATVDAEIDGPVFANPTPSHMGATDDASQVISVDVADELAGVDRDSIVFKVIVSGQSIDVANDDLSDIEEISGGYRASVDLDDVIDDIVEIDDSETTLVEWYAMAKDNAGNSRMSDAVADNENDDGMAIRDNYEFNVDGEDPEIMRVYTGDWFDSVAEEVKGDRRIGVETYLPGASNNASLRVLFDERVDGATVSADDFSVDGAAPTDAQWYGKGDTGDEFHIGRSVFLTVPAMAADSTPTVRIVGSVSDVAGNSADSGTKIADDGIAPTAMVSVDKALSDGKVTVTVETDEGIRTLSPDLALYISNGPAVDDERDVFTVEREDPDDTESALVLRRKAGGTIVANEGEFDYDDTIRLFLSKAPILDQDGVTGIDSNDVEVTPTALVQEVPGDDGVDAKSGEVEVKVVKTAEDDAGAMQNVGLAMGDMITVDYRGTDADPARGLAGVPNPSGRQVSATSWTFALNVARNDRYAATATAEDSSRNRRTGGEADPTAAGATVFEIDSRLAGGEAARTEPIQDASGNSPVSFADPFVIELYWDGSKSGDEGIVAADEGNEYPGDSSDTVTLTKAELDGVDVLDTSVAQSANSFRLAIADISLGEHTLKYNAEDALGNTNATDRLLRFTVQPVPTWDLALTAGMNLISLPSNPANTDINEVFGATEEIDLIFTFEGAQSKVALRNQDTGQFGGTLTAVDSAHAYWVSASKAAKVEISIPPTSQLAPPPYITVKGGQWNLIPVMSLGKVEDNTAGVGAAPGTAIDADRYLGEFRTAFGWGGRNWSKIEPQPATAGDRLTDGATVKVGMGYWVLYDEDSIITP